MYLQITVTLNNPIFVVSWHYNLKNCSEKQEKNGKYREKRNTKMIELG